MSHCPLAALKRSDRTLRKRREGASSVVLVGYTNAGKTSLMNALTSTELSAADRPFETLDTTCRSLTRHGGDVLLSDSVGFIQRLPERLYESFESTLAEVREASLLAIVLDASDPEVTQHWLTTHSVLERLSAANTPKLAIFNKVDRLAEPPSKKALHMLSDGHPCIALSSRDAGGVERLRQAILLAVRKPQRRLTCFIPYERTDLTSMAYGRCRVIEAVAAERGMQFVLEGNSDLLEDIAHQSRRAQTRRSA